MRPNATDVARGLRVCLCWVHGWTLPKRLNRKWADLRSGVWTLDGQRNRVLDTVQIPPAGIKGALLRVFARLKSIVGRSVLPSSESVWACSRLDSLDTCRLLLKDGRKMPTPPAPYPSWGLAQFTFTDRQMDGRTDGRTDTRPMRYRFPLWYEVIIARVSRDWQVRQFMESVLGELRETCVRCKASV